MCALVPKSFPDPLPRAMPPGPPLEDSARRPPLSARAPALAIAAHSFALPTSNYLRRP